MLASVPIHNRSFMTLPSTSKPYVRWHAPSPHVRGVNAHVRAGRRGSGHVCRHVSRQWSACPVHGGLTLVHVAVIPHLDSCSSLLSAFPTSHLASLPTCSSQDVRRNVIKPESDHVTPVLRTVSHGPHGSRGFSSWCTRPGITWPLPASPALICHCPPWPSKSPAVTAELPCTP